MFTAQMNDRSALKVTSRADTQKFALCAKVLSDRSAWLKFVGSSGVGP